MNEHSSKKILFNKSSLFSLKAELLKKQEEVYEKKKLPESNVENYKPPSSKTKSNACDENAKKGYKKSFKDRLTDVNVEELEACRKSKLALEKKAELYEHLSDGAGSSQFASKFLVDFNTKKQQEPEKCPSPPRKIPSPVNDQSDDDSEWTEFTDCLGRTRKCLKTDIDVYIKRDKELLRAITKESIEPEPTENVDVNDISSSPEKPLLVQKTNDYLQSLRVKWDQKEQELLAKEKDIHYQDILFDEARIHGVGYYSFSTDETERRSQMNELIKLRQDTLKAQKLAEEQRLKHEGLMAARVAAARARTRARAGLPPEEPQENRKDFTACLLEFLTQQKNEADAKAHEQEKQHKEEKEKERQKLRETYVREWDVGKEGVDGKTSKFREMSQEEYVEQQRAKRLDEFAPLQSTSSNKSIYEFDKSGKIKNRDDSVSKKSWAEVRPEHTAPPPDIGDYQELTEQKGLFFSTSKKTDAVKYRNFVKAQEITPIQNEVNDEENDNDNVKSAKRGLEANHTEIPPPPTYDYYGPVPKQSRPEKPFESDLREAYAQGAESLKSKTQELLLSKHYDFTFD